MGEARKRQQELLKELQAFHPNVKPFIIKGTNGFSYHVLPCGVTPITLKVVLTAKHKVIKFTGRLDLYQIDGRNFYAKQLVNRIFCNDSEDVFDETLWGETDVLNDMDLIIEKLEEMRDSKGGKQ